MRTIILCVLLAACVPISETYAPDGKPALYARCRVMVHCYDAARERCQGPYVPLKEGIGGSMAYGAIQGGNGYMYAGTELGLTFRCQ